MYSLLTRGEAPVPEPKVRSPPVDMMEERREEGAAVITRELYICRGLHPQLDTHAAPDF